jgi:predicted MFS family arabinose efflux permease
VRCSRALASPWSTRAWALKLCVTHPRKTAAMGAYTTFLDVALGFGSPALGLIAGWAGLRSVFLAGALLVLSAALVALRLLMQGAVTSNHLNE